MLPSLEHLIPFLTATLVFAVMPGPALLFSASQTIIHGCAKALTAVLGLHIGGIVHVLAASLGLSAIFTHAPVLYTLVKIAGAVYLIWLGINIIRSPVPAGQMHVQAGRKKKHLFYQGVVVEVLNPKTALFFIAFLPQFVDPSAGPVWMQFVLLGWFVNVCFSAADVVAICFTSKVVSTLGQSQIKQRIVRMTGGSILVGLGAHLAISR